MVTLSLNFITNGKNTNIYWTSQGAKTRQIATTGRSPGRVPTECWCTLDFDSWTAHLQGSNACCSFQIYLIDRQCEEKCETHVTGTLLHAYFLLNSYRSNYSCVYKLCKTRPKQTILKLQHWYEACFKRVTESTTSKRVVHKIICKECPNVTPTHRRTSRGYWNTRRKLIVGAVSYTSSRWSLDLPAKMKEKLSWNGMQPRFTNKSRFQTITTMLRISRDNVT